MRRLKARLRLLYNGVSFDFELARTAFGKSFAPTKASKSAWLRSTVMKVSGRRASAASAIAFALLGPEEHTSDRHHFQMTEIKMLFLLVDIYEHSQP